MIKVIAAILALVGLATSAHAQENKIGLRFGTNDGIGTEINYQRGLSDANRLELGLGYEEFNNADFIRLIALYEWVWDLDKGFDWYAGAGGGLGNFSYDNALPNGDNGETFIFVAGTIGIEYRFDFPITIAIDTRPQIYFSDFADTLKFDTGLAVRYRF